MGRAAGMTWTIKQGTVVGLELDAQADKVAFDLRVNVAELVGGEEGRVMVERAGGGGGEFEDRGRLGEADAGGGRVGRPARRRSSRRSARRCCSGPTSCRRLARSCSIWLALARTPLVERNFWSASAMSRLCGAAAEQVLPGWRGVVVGADLGEQVAVELERFARVERGDRVAEAAIVVALFETVVEPGRVEAAGERRRLPDGRGGLLRSARGLRPSGRRTSSERPLSINWLIASADCGGRRRTCGRRNEVL